MKLPQTSFHAVAGLALLASMPTSRAAIITAGLVGEWTFESGDATDSTGLIGNGTNVGAPAYGTVAGRSGTVLTTSQGNYVSIADDADIPSGNEARTVSLWLQTSTFANGSGPFRSGNTANGQDFSIETTNSAGSIRANGWNADTTFDVTGDATGWHNIIVVYDGTNVIPYVDGIAANITDGGGPFTLNTASNGIRFGGPRINQTGNDDGTFNIDDVLVYNRALSASEAATIAGIPEPSVTLLGALGVLGLIRRRRG